MHTGPRRDLRIAQQIGRQLRQLRTQQGLTALALGNLAGFTQQHITRVEQGEIDIPVGSLARIAAVLGVSFGLRAPRPERGVPRLQLAAQLRAFRRELQDLRARVTAAEAARATLQAGLVRGPLAAAGVPVEACWP